MSQVEGSPYGNIVFLAVVCLERTWERGREDSVLGRFEVSMIWKAVTSVSVLVCCSSLLVGIVEGREERKRVARAKRCRFCRTRMSQSTSSSRMRAVVRFWSTIL
jgi:hypothetical protein